MIIWLNGSFGSGKTSVSKDLYDRLDKAVIFDPEETGIFIRRCVPEADKLSDFQDHPLWSKLNFDILHHMSRQSHKYIIVPMTIVDADKYNNLIIALKNHQVNVKVIELNASKATLHSRLKERGDQVGAWSYDQIDRCLEGLKGLDHDYTFNTEVMSVESISKSIIEHISKTD